MNKKVNILFSSFPDFSGNPKALYEYINNNYSKHFNTFWVFYSKQTIEILEKNHLKINYVIFDTNEYYDLLNKIDIIFDTHGSLLSDKKDYQIYVNLWHGTSPKEKGFLLPESKFAPQDKDYYKNMHLKADYVIVPSYFSKLVFSSAFDINVQRVVPLGYCRDDYLLNTDGKKILKKITNIDVSKFNKILFYLPTFRQGLNRKDSQNLFKDNLLELSKYDEQELCNYLEENNYLLVIKKHPSEESEIKLSTNKNILVLDEQTLNSNLITIYDILNAADLLIADYSSVYIEYLLLNKPIIFLHKDYKNYTKHRGLILNNIDFWSPGPQVTKLKKFTSEISKLLDDETYYSKERQLLKELMFDKNYSDFCLNTFNFFFDSTTFKLKVTPFNTDEKQLISDYKELTKTNEQLNNKISDLETSYSQDRKALVNEIDSLKAEIERIHNSRLWKYYYKFKTKKE